MLIKFFPKLGDNLIVTYLKQGLESKYSAILIAALTLASNLFAWEIPVFYACTVIVILASLFCDDLRCLIPLACCMYYPFSKETSEQLQHLDVQIQLGIVIVVIAIFAISRLVFELVTKPERRKLPKLTWGFVALGAVYLLGGLFSAHYSINTVLFGFSQIFAFSFSYFFFYFTVDFQKIDKSYFAYLMTVIGILLCGEMLGVLYFSDFFKTIFTTEGAFSRSALSTGWGGYNNLAAALIMSLPAPFYYATTKKHGWAYLLLGNVFFLFLLLTQSRGGMLFGACVYGLCVLVTIWKSKERKNLIITELVIIILVETLCLLFYDKFYNTFASVISAGMNDSGRFSIYLDGLNAFLEAPVLGTGFTYNLYDWGGLILPYRYHNTYVQLLASCGVVGLLVYFYHRYETARMIFKKRNVEKYFIGICILGLLLTSLLDIHFFNFHPGFTYSALLLFLEIDWLREEPKTIEQTSVAEAAISPKTTEEKTAEQTEASAE